MKILKEPNNRISFESIPERLKLSRWNDETLLSSGNKVVFNTLYRSAIIVPSKFNFNEEYVTLYRLGMLVDEQLDEQLEFERTYIAAKKDMSYIDLTILTTKQCQFGCIYCFEGGKSKESISSQTMDDIIHFISYHSHTCRRLRVTWFGGEPLLGYKQMQNLSERLITYCDKVGISYSADITTNGFALSPNRCKDLVKKMRIHRFIITLDGLKEVHNNRRPLLGGGDTFNRIWNNIDSLLDAGAQVNIRMTIDRNNASHIPVFLDALSCSSFSNKVGLAFCRTIDFGYTPDAIKESLYTEQEFADIEWKLLKYARKLELLHFGFPHSAPQGGCLRDGDIVIGTNGEIYKCLDTLGNKKWITGNITNTEFSNKAEWYSQWLNWTPSQSTSCRHCKLIPLCSGGCPHNALFREKMHGTESQCPDWKANYQRQIKTLAEEYEKTI